jgi:hypothetical protein
LVKKESCIFFNSTLFANKAGKRVKRFHGYEYRLKIKGLRDSKQIVPTFRLGFDTTQGKVA